jgi:hypothetical protein
MLQVPVDETHSGVVHHPIPDTTPIPPCTPRLTSSLITISVRPSGAHVPRSSALCPNDMVDSMHTGFTSFRTLYHSALSPPLSCSRSPSSVSPFHNINCPALCVTWPQPRLRLRSRWNLGDAMTGTKRPFRPVCCSHEARRRSRTGTSSLF